MRKEYAAMDAMVEPLLTSSDVNAAPDWSVVPFAVTCARCGHDLHGQSEPTCLGCALTFRWADAVPIEQLTCTSCGYHLYGLKEPRCPECGNEFTWDEALADYYRRKPLFEFQWKTHPIRSLIRTSWLCLQPKKLWSSVKLHEPVSTFPLFMFGMLTVVGISLIASFTFLLLLALWAYLRTPVTYLQMRGITLGEHFLEHFWILIHHMPTFSSIVCGYLILWTIGLACGLFIFQQSMFRRKLRPVHIVRIVIYGTTGTWLGIWTSTLVNFSVDRFSYIQGEIAGITLFTGCLALGFSIRSIALAYRDYLRFDHPWAVSLAANLIAVLFAAVAAIPLMPRGIGIWLLVEISRVFEQAMRAG